MAKRVELPQGTLELLILKSISLGPLHGYGILLRIHGLTPFGRRQLKEETTKWFDMADVVTNILRTSTEEI